MIRTMNQFTRAVWDRPSCIQGVDLTNSARWLMALVLLTIATLASAASWDDDSHYVPLGPRTGYYIVRPGSPLSHQLGVESAPTIDTADPFRHGYTTRSKILEEDDNTETPEEFNPQSKEERN